MTKYNWGMIGTGWIAHEMADALNTVNGEVYAVADVNEEMLKKFAAEKYIKKTYTDPDKMIADPNIDIIYIATPHTFHYEYIKKALNAGKHVFCEKAITVNARQFDEVEKLAKEKLGMEKLTSKHTIYINLPKQEYTESESEKVVIEDDKNWFEKLIDSIFNKD